MCTLNYNPHYYLLHIQFICKKTKDLRTFWFNVLSKCSKLLSQKPLAFTGPICVCFTCGSNAGKVLAQLIFIAIIGVIAFDGASLWDCRLNMGMLVLWGLIIFFVAARVFRWE